jgi:predicted RNA-binding protein YlqC (UPF0109 family)
MKELLDYVIRSIAGEGNYEIQDVVDDNHTTFEVLAKPDVIGLLIGKEGRTVKSIRNLLKVRATIDKKTFTLRISESG